ncbi:unnamed protein product [Timema podura]|uniref:Uncharacterized protein n=1 Tax=Timema podura TaxID=61482 RepID=A0ABN7PHL4_TIMPD|nr:unnamed protein product [Timema podura]
MFQLKHEPIIQICLLSLELDYLYWADSDHGTVTRIRRDGTGREVVVEHFESMESIPVDWLTGLAVDWIAGNIYWTDPKFSVIETARLNGSHRYVVVTGNMDRPTSIAVDPVAGYLFWSDAGREPKLERARLDGTERTVIVNVEYQQYQRYSTRLQERKGVLVRLQHQHDSRGSVTMAWTEKPC